MTFSKIILRSVLVLCTFILHFCTTGFTTSIGVFYIEFLDDFQFSHGVTSWFGSINFAVICWTCPLGSYVSTKHGCSVCVLIGGLLSVVGLLITSFSPNLLLIIISFGLITGVGFGLVFTGSILILALSIQEWRSLCTGISMAGISLGTTLHPFLSNFLIVEYGWRNSLIIMAGICMHICLISQLIWTTEWQLKRLHKIETKKNMGSNNDVTQNKRKQHTDLFDLQETLDVNELRKHDQLRHKMAKPVSDTRELKKHDKRRHTMAIPLSGKSETSQLFWKMPMYWALYFNTLLFCFGQSILFTHLAAFAKAAGQSLEQASSHISAFGISCLFGRVILSLISHSPKMDNYVLFVASYVICGVSTISYTAFRSYIYMLISSIFIGFWYSAYGPILTEITILTVQKENFPTAYSFTTFCSAFGAIVGAPCAGWLYDYTLQYQNSFYLGGSTIIISTFPIILLLLRAKLSSKKLTLNNTNVVFTKTHTYKNSTDIKDQYTIDVI